MKLYKTNTNILLERKGQFFQHPLTNWDECTNRPQLHQALLEDIKNLSPLNTSLSEQAIQAPIGSQEIWAAGVTYYRSRVARMEESQDAGGADFYDKVYDAERPEIFFKATAARTSGTGGELYIRKDSDWNVPEPELTLFMCSEGSIEGYTIGNDMSSRSIEGENPLYLPQAKVYEKCAGLGPCLYVPAEPLPSSTTIQLQIKRVNEVIFDKSIAIDQMKRGHQELADYLFRECNFPSGCFLMTGTGIVPDNDFSLQIGDQLRIHISSIGSLENTVGQKP